MFVYLKMPNVGTPGRNKGGRLIGGEVRVREGSFFLFFFIFFYIIYSLLRYKKSHGALAMAKTKPKSQNELTKEKSITGLFNWGMYRAQAHILARNSNK